MPSTYTLNSGIELIGTGEQSGTWGDTTNINLQIIDRLTSGVGEITLPTTPPPAGYDLTTTDGALSDGQYRALIFGGTPSGATQVNITPNDQEKIYFVKNNSGQGVTMSQGSGSTVSVADGNSAIVYADGGGAVANVVDLTSTFNFQNANANLTDISGLSPTEGHAIVGNGTDYISTATATSAMIMPSGVTGDRPTPVNGMIRYNTDDGQFEGYAAGSWGAIAGQGEGGGAIIVNDTTATESYTFGAGTNGFSVGPVSVANGVTITISSGQRWVVI